MNGLVTVRAVPSIAGIGEATWNSLARDGGFYLGYPWLTWAEADPSVTASYLIAMGADGTALGAVVTYLWDGCPVPSMNLAYSPGHIAASAWAFSASSTSSSRGADVPSCPAIPAATTTGHAPPRPTPS